MGVGRSKFSRGVRPDFIFPKLRVAVFVDGCFWHGCPQHAIDLRQAYGPQAQPKTNAKFWRDKIEGNRFRDRQVDRQLRRLGWKVIRVWEHELRRKDEARLILRLQKYL